SMGCPASSVPRTLAVSQPTASFFPRTMGLLVPSRSLLPSICRQHTLTTSDETLLVSGRKNSAPVLGSPQFTQFVATSSGLGKVSVSRLLISQRKATAGRTNSAAFSVESNTIYSGV